MTETKTLIKSFDWCEAQARLDALPFSDNNIFEKNIWWFDRGAKGRISVDFNDLSDFGERYSQWPTAKTVDWVSLTKWIWLSLVSSTSPYLFVTRLHGLKMLWVVLAESRQSNLGRDQGYDLAKFFLMNSWHQGYARKNFSVKSRNNFFELFRLREWKLLLSDLGIDWINRGLTVSFIKKQLKILIPELTDEELTYRDWFEGGSHNLLTLDYGRYYVEHCLEFFGKYYPLARALASTYAAIPSLASSAGYALSTFSALAPEFLRGYSAEDIMLRKKNQSITTLRNAEVAITRQFKTTYEQVQFEFWVTQEEGVKTVARSLGLSPSPENIDRIRVIVWDWINRRDKQETQELLANCNPAVQWATFKNQLNKIRKRFSEQHYAIPTKEDYEEFGLCREPIGGTGLSDSRQLIHLVEKAGLIIVIALTGWRKSEYGFPSSAIKRTSNQDKLDQYAFPWRYQVEWFVPKQHGQTLLLREVTFTTVLVAERLRSLLGVTSDQPCLYKSMEKSQASFDSGLSVQRAVRTLWGHFVWNYRKFKEVDDWNSWQQIQKRIKAGESLSKQKDVELSRLLSARTSDQWENLAIESNLKEAWRRARSEWPRLEIFFASSSMKDKKDWLLRYRERSLRPDWIELLDRFLPEKIQDLINSLPKSELKSRSLSKEVMNVLTEETLYPSPHAFRHMWAEAVYRRFDGDAGWMIRSQFKHITRAQWLSYIRDKDNRKIHEQAKVQVICSLVNNYVKNKGKGYAGQFHTWLRRLLYRTSVLSPREQEKLVERLVSSEIENVKANPWGYCLLKRRTRNQAKCAEMGEPMRHNASPDLCLGCVHNLMQSENVDWAVFHISAHVEALSNPVVPKIFKASSYALVKNVTRHVRTLNPNHEALPELVKTLRDNKPSGVS
ncbi:hypothetical protein [Marinobacter sp.]|uniref:hypothetical protein n=1 Tax=Marinobacter sp. TaxID=50741 RepID=UPI001B658BDF|nr:hypothetical protein [Marinobacter sp.]MBQ0832935.1 hypothetical protein [Marinobacter sp.]